MTNLFGRSITQDFSFTPNSSFSRWKAITVSIVIQNTNTHKCWLLVSKKKRSEASWLSNFFQIHIQILFSTPGKSIAWKGYTVSFCPCVLWDNFWLEQHSWNLVGSAFCYERSGYRSRNLTLGLHFFATNSTFVRRTLPIFCELATIVSIPRFTRSRIFVVKRRSLAVTFAVYSSSSFLIRRVYTRHPVTTGYFAPPQLCWRCLLEWRKRNFWKKTSSKL